MTDVPGLHTPADLFRFLGDPLRVRVLETLRERPCDFPGLLAALDLEPPVLADLLAGLRGAGLVSTTGAADRLVYSLHSPALGDLLTLGGHIAGA